MPLPVTTASVKRRLPVGDEIFLDHVGHFVRDAQAASRALRRAGFAPTPVSIQVDKDPSTGRLVPTGLGNVTAMFARGYLEVLFKNSDTPLAGTGFLDVFQRYPVRGSALRLLNDRLVVINF